MPRNISEAGEEGKEFFARLGEGDGLFVKLGEGKRLFARLGEARGFSCRVEAGRLPENID